ncbi:class I adenylate-forming enzyme family protein [Bacillus thermotolerans]|uniref:class I adenylate-forming enzyme family protein n=1 Tax=Bacillus thermotolerans TaxID=1221996 RepID=UPI00057EF2CB|nr:class I adenylate-forming enzyme family protein [Bacillus thermotolerans]KKB35190.1 Acetoacetyl-CoA synthetase [Bacillus thermotolerans]
MVTSCYGLSVAQLLEKANQSCPEKEVIYDGDRRITYSALHREALEVAIGLHRLGVRKGDRVAVSLPAWYEFIVAVFAIAKVGGILVPFNTRYREEEAEHILRDSGAKVVLFTKEYDGVNHFEQFQSIQKRVESLQYLITVRFYHSGLISYDELREAGVNQALPEVAIDVEEDVFSIIYTSGTTGKPKGAMLTHHNLVSSMINSCIGINIQTDDVFLHASPFFHVMGLAGILRLVGSETKAVILEKYQVEKALQLIEQEKVTIHSGVPTIFILELNHPNFSSYDLSSLRVSIMAGAPCPVEVIRRIKEEMGCPVLVSFGMTETSPILTMTSFEDDEIIQAETVGRALAGVELKVVDENRKEVRENEVGEIACRTEGLMKGYYNLPEKTREVIDEDRWFYTGDLGTIDGDGYVRIIGRKKDLVIRGGYNIYPSEIEEVFYTHPSVNEAAIIGLPDTVLGEVSCAAITLKEHADATVEELEQFIKQQVADYKAPDHIVIVEELPKTPSGKIMKFVLKDSIVKEKAVVLR